MRLSFSILLIFGLRLSLQAQDISLLFDWDDNAFNMPTKILLKRTSTGGIVRVSTRDFAILKRQLNKPGSEFQMYPGSLRFFGDDPRTGRNYFLEDIETGLEEPEKFLGPSAGALIIALSHEELARNTYFVTARGAGWLNFREGLGRLQEIGWFGYLPPEDNWWRVTSPDFEEQFRRVFGEAPPSGGADSPAARKSAVMTRLYNRINASPFERQRYKVYSPDGEGRGYYKLVGFSDDDFDNFANGRTEFGRHMRSNAWPRIKPSIFFTGLNDPKERARVEVIRGDGHTRSLLKGEDIEWVELARKKYGDLWLNPQVGAASVRAVVEACQKRKIGLRY